MSRVATSLPPMRYTNGADHSTKATKARSPAGTNGLPNGVERRPFNVRSTIPASIQKETVHACPLCSNEYKDPRVLPCTHTYCYNCVRDQLINNSRLTCPKCHHQVHPFDETYLQDLPPNLILSQEWRIGARPTPSMPPSKKPMTYQPRISSSPPSQSVVLPPSRDSEKRRSMLVEHRAQDVSMSNDTSLNGIASIVNAFNRSSTTGENGGRPSRSPSMSSLQPVVSNLIKIYSEATPPQNKRHDDGERADKQEELIKVFEQARADPRTPTRSRSPSNVRQPSIAREEVCEELTWDSLVHGTNLPPPPITDELQSAVEHRHNPPAMAERPISVTSANLENLREMITSIDQQTPSPRPLSSLEAQLFNRLSANYHPQHDEDDEEEDIVEHVSRQNTPQRPGIRQLSNTDSIHSPASNSLSRRSPITSAVNNSQSRLQIPSIQEREDDKLSHTTVSSRPSSEHFPPPPKQIDPLDSPPMDTVKQRTSSLSNHSSVTEDLHDQLLSPDAKVQRTERFNPTENTSPAIQRNRSSEMGSYSSTPTYRPLSISHEREERPVQRSEKYASMSSSSLLVPSAVTSRVETLLSDQKRLEREIEEHIRCLRYDYDDVRRQIHRKQSSIHNEVKSIANRLDDDISEHFQRKQKIYADLAADTSSVGTELERLRASGSNNKQQLWANLEQIECNIRSIRQAVEQQKEQHGALAFAEGRRAIGADAMGQLTCNGFEPHRSYGSSSISQLANVEQPITSLTPYKYLKIDHLSTLEPEALAITENKKKILLGICNKLFILSEFGDILKTIPLTPSIRGIAVSKKHGAQNVAYVSHDEIVTMIDVDSGQVLDCVKDSSEDVSTFLPLGIDTDGGQGFVYVCDYRNSSVLKFDDKLEFITQWRIYNHSDQYDEARPKLISVNGQRLYVIVEHSCKPYYNQGIAYTFSLHICDVHSGSVLKIIDADQLSTQRLRWPCSIYAIGNDTCYILDTMTSGKYFNGQWQKHWSRVLEIKPNEKNVVGELFQLDSEAATMALAKQTMIICANGEILFVDLAFVQQQLQLTSYERS